MQRAIGLLAVILGVLGALLLAAGAAACWQLERQAVDRTDRVAVRVSDLLAKIEEQLQPQEKRVADITIDVRKIEAAAANVVERALTEALAQSENQLLDRLSGSLAQCEELGETLHLMAELFQDIAELSAQLDGNQNVSDQLQEVSVAIDSAAKTFIDIRAELAELRLREPTPNPRKLTDLVAQTRVPLERLAGAIGSIRQRVDEARKAVDNVRSKIRFWARSAAVLACLAMAWFGWGQICLIGWGWGKLRSAPRANRAEPGTP